jgi:hypothetical protein
MAYDSIPFVQSVLYQSPYSGCRRFSGWPPQPSIQPPGTTFPSPYNTPGAILCVDRYQKTFKPLGTPATPRYGPPRATFTSLTPAQGGRFTVAGPSSKGPFTYGQQRGICWGGDTQWPISSGGGGSGHNLGLG